MAFYLDHRYLQPVDSDFVQCAIADLQTFVDRGCSLVHREQRYWVCLEKIILLSLPKNFVSPVSYKGCHSGGGGEECPRFRKTGGPKKLRKRGWKKQWLAPRFRTRVNLWPHRWRFISFFNKLKVLLDYDRNVNFDWLWILVASTFVFSVILFPPFTSYHRYLLHRVVMDYYSTQLASFSVGEGDGRRTLIYFSDDYISKYFKLLS